MAGAWVKYWHNVNWKIIYTSFFQQADDVENLELISAGKSLTSTLKKSFIHKDWQKE